MNDISEDLSELEILDQIGPTTAIENLNLTFNSEDHSIFNERSIKNTLHPINVDHVEAEEPVCIKDKFPYKHVHSGFCENLTKGVHIYSNGADVKGNFHATAEFLCPCTVCYKQACQKSIRSKDDNKVYTFFKGEKRDFCWLLEHMIPDDDVRGCSIKFPDSILYSKVKGSIDKVNNPPKT